MVHLLEACKNLQALGNELILIVGSPKPYPGSLPFRVIYLPYIKLKFFPAMTLQVFLFLYLLYYGFKLGCDVIYENCVFCSCSGALAAKILGVPHAMQVHGFYVDEMKMGGHGGFMLFLVKFYEYINYKLTDALFCVTPVVRQKITELYKIRPGVAHFVYNGVDADRCKPMPKSEAAKALGMNADNLYIGFIGYIFPWSGMDKLVAIAPQVVKEVPQARFVIVGHGIWGEQLPGMIEKVGMRDYFILTGYQPWERIPLYCNLFDIGITPYPGDMGVGRYRSSMKTLEYSAAGTPVVITRCEGVSDIVENGRCGLVVDPDDNGQLAEVVIRLLKDPQLRKELGGNGRKMIEEGYTWRHMAEKMLDIIGKVRRKQ